MKPKSLINFCKFFFCFFRLLLNCAIYQSYFLLPFRFELHKADIFWNPKMCQMVKNFSYGIANHWMDLSFRINLAATYVFNRLEILIFLFALWIIDYDYYQYYLIFFSFLTNVWPQTINRSAFSLSFDILMNYKQTKTSLKLRLNRIWRVTDDDSNHSFIGHFLGDEKNQRKKTTLKTIKMVLFVWRTDRNTTMAWIQM